MAVEEVLLRGAGEEPLFLLWQNSPAVILGRNQNAFEEVDLQFAEKNQIQIMRRLTGGGAVYHDLGNLNYTFILPQLSHASKESPLFDFRLWTNPVLRTLQKLGVQAEFTGRNDLTVLGKKFSGNAQARIGKHLLHHGTLLFHTDFQMMVKVLHVDPDKFHSKGVASTRSRVTNLTDYLPDGFGIGDFKKALINEISCSYQLTQSSFSERQIEEINSLKTSKYSTRNWNIGKSPKSNMKTEHRFPWGKVCIDLFLEKGIVSDAKISGDFFATMPPELLAEKLIGLEYNFSVFSEQFTEDEIQSFFPQISKDDFIKLLFK